MIDRPPLRASFVALHALPAVSNRYPGPIGGTETRAWTLSRGLAAHADGIVPTLVVRAPEQPVPDAIEGVAIRTKSQPLYDAYVNVGRSLERSQGFPPVRLRQFTPSLLWQLPVVACDRLLRFRNRDPRRPDDSLIPRDADVVVTFGVQATSATAIATAKSYGIPSAVMIGCDDDLSARYLSHPSERNPYGDRGDLCHWILHNADLVVCQTLDQAGWLEERFKRVGAVLPNPIGCAAWQRASLQTPRILQSLPERYLLWIGRAEGVHKRPERLIDLAELRTDVEFLMVMNRADPLVAERVYGRCPDNVHIIEKVDVDDMPAVIARSSGLVNTSAAEGFPNAFLQAAVCRRPVLSLTVLADFLHEHRFGRACDGDAGILAEAAGAAYGAVRGTAVPEISFAPEIASRYVEDTHDVPAVVEQFTALLRALTGADSAV